MRFFELVLSGAALLSAALAVTIDTFPEGGVQAGQTYTITYSPKDQPATFILRRGNSQNLDTVATLGTGTGGSFSWTVSPTLANDNSYALQVKQGTDENYTKQFGLTGGSGSLSLSSVVASASSAASSARASASSVLSSLSARVSSAAASATISPSAGTNSTIVSPTLSRTATVSVTARPSGSSTTSASGPPQNTGAASALDSSPLALIFGAVAAFAYLH